MEAKRYRVIRTSSLDLSRARFDSAVCRFNCAEVRESAKQETQLIVREARRRTDALIRAAGTVCQHVEQKIAYLQRKRTDVKAPIEGSSETLRHALECVSQHDCDRPQHGQIRQHDSRANNRRAATVRGVLRPGIVAVEAPPSA